MNELPTGWAWAELGELGVWYGGATPKKDRADFWDYGTIPWLSPKDMGPDVLEGTQDHISSIALNESAVRLVPENSVAIVVRSGILERKVPIALVPFATTLNQDMKAISPYDGIDGRWVAWGLRAFERDILRDCRKAGTTVSSIEISRLMTFKLPIPSLPEQRRIIAALDKHMSHLASASAAVSRARTLYPTFYQSILSTAISGQRGSESEAFSAADELESFAIPYTKSDRLPEGWVTVKLGDIADTSSGGTPSRSNLTYYGGDIPWIKSGELGDSRVSQTAESITEAGLNSSSARLLPQGTLLIAMYGATIGKLGIIDVQQAATNQAVCAIHPKIPDLRDFLWHTLEAIRPKLIDAGQGGAQPNISQTLIRSLLIDIPPRATRIRISHALEAKKSELRSLYERIEQAGDRSDRLRQILLNSAFRGSLLPPDPDDEPASVMLSRIQAKRVAGSKGRRGSRTKNKNVGTQGDLLS
ncbi:restriction endonuclease subunit S [Nonomuraea pusilla]|uniref:restriction endonuclease subunit S n=1 Tax=Nonomuraea pusilla TaxID=46177 RepID=UPI003316DD19